MIPQFRDDSVVVVWIHDDRNELMILRCGSEHRRPADVYVLQRLFAVTVNARDRGLEGIQVHNQQVDGTDPVFGHRRGVQIATGQESAMDFRMQGLDAAVHELREPGNLRDVRHREAGVAQRRRGSAGRDDLDVHVNQ